jgi:hypothetical protein
MKDMLLMREKAFRGDDSTTTARRHHDDSPTS